MGIKQVKVGVNDLTLGMFVSGLDRPWSQTPFPLQGFYIREMTEIRDLKAICHYVYIDIAKGSGPLKTQLQTLSRKPDLDEGRGAKESRIKVPVSPLKINRTAYSVPTVSLKKEMQSVGFMHQEIFHTVGEVVALMESGETVSLKETRRVASNMVDSVLRNPDALTWLTKIKDVDEYSYEHSMRAAIWAIIFGRHIGMEKRDLDTLAMGVLLKDIGKALLPQEVLLCTDRDDAQQRAYERFVELGVQALREVPNMDSKVIAVVKTHCERINGSGFPLQLRGDKIPLLGKVAGIVTFYDEVVNPRGGKSLSPSKAVAQLYAARDKEFQEELVVEFIRAIGLYPTGTLVELSTGQVAVVVEQNFERRLKPKVMIVLDAHKRPLAEPVLLDMAEDDRQKQELVDKGKKSLAEVGKIEIAYDIEPGVYTVDVAAVRDKYLLSEDKKKGLFALFKRKSA